MNSKAQIIATIGPASCHPNTLREMIRHELDLARLNFSWGDLDTHASYIKTIRTVAHELNRSIPIIIDLPGPRIQEASSHTYNPEMSALTAQDKTFIEFAVNNHVEYVAVSFVGTAHDIEACKIIINNLKGTTKVIAKIERKMALDHLDNIIGVADAVMVARGDLGNEIPLEQIPFAQALIISKCNKAEKPVITATQMMLSMVDHDTPTRAEVTDVANAILLGSDAVMFSEETATGNYPVQAVVMMEKIIIEAEKHASRKEINTL